MTVERNRIYMIPPKYNIEIEGDKFDGMPRNAIATGFVDMIQKPDSSHGTQ